MFKRSLHQLLWLSIIFVSLICLKLPAQAVLPPSIDHIYPPKGSKNVALNSEIWLYGVGIGNIPLFNPELAGPELIPEKGGVPVPTHMLGSALKHYPAEDLKNNRVGIIGGATPYTLLRLKPVRDLAPNTRYRIDLHDILGEEPENLPTHQQQNIQMEFETGQQRDQNAPRWEFEYSPRPYRGGQEGYNNQEAEYREYILIHTSAPADTDSTFTRVEYSYKDKSGGFQIFDPDIAAQDVVLRGQGCVIGTAYDMAGNASSLSTCREASYFWQLAYWARIQSSMILVGSLILFPLGVWGWHSHKKKLTQKEEDS